MATLASREISISYGGFVIGGNTRPIHEFVQEDLGRDQMIIRAKFLTASAGSASAARSEWDLCEAAMQKNHKALTVTYGAGASKTYDPSSNTGFNTVAQIAAVGSEFDSNLRRLYEVTITVELPSNDEDTNGLRESKVRVEYDKARRRSVLITGSFTALGGNSASAQYTATIGTFCSAVLTALGGTFNQDSATPTPGVVSDDEDFGYDTKNKVMQFERRFTEILFAQGGAAELNDPDIIEQSLSLNRTHPHEGNSRSNGTKSVLVNPVETIEITYEATINFGETTDLRAKWESIRQWVIDQAREYYQPRLLVLIDEQPRFMPDQNKLAATLRLQSIGAGTFLRFERAESNQLTTGRSIQPVASGNPFDARQINGPGRLIQSVELRAEQEGDQLLNPFDPPSPPPIPDSAELASPVRIVRDSGPRRIVRTRGQLGSDVVVTEWSWSVSWIVFSEVQQRVIT